MKHTELMIGDWMQHANGKYYQVTRIDGLHDGRIHFACGTPHLWEYNNKFEPIPLTPEILHDNGFTNTEFYAELLFDGWQVLADCRHLKAKNQDSSIDIPCEYVHQLQQAFRLCNIEKEIIL